MKCRNFLKNLRIWPFGILLMERHTEIEHVLRPDLLWDCMQYKVVWRVPNQMAHRDAQEGK